jgi:hypothetical protein
MVPRSLGDSDTPPKFAIRLFFVRRTKNKQPTQSVIFQASSVTAAIIGFGAVPWPGFTRKL